MTLGATCLKMVARDTERENDHTVVAKALNKAAEIKNNSPTNELWWTQ
jgi:hypothetical protein